MKKRKSCVIVFLICTLLLSPAYVLADTPEDITEIIYPEVYLDEVEGDTMSRAVSSGTISFKRDSSTSASGYATINTTAVADYIKVTVTLQQAASGSTNYTNSNQDPVTRTVYDNNYIRKTFTFKVTSTKNYRVKVVVKDKINGVVSTKTLYKKLS